MSDSPVKYIWRCAKCSCHFSNISQIEGVLRQEKKCPKCKSLNILTLTDKEIIIHCKLFDRQTKNYQEEVQENYNY